MLQVDAEQVEIALEAARALNGVHERFRAALHEHEATEEITDLFWRAMPHEMTATVLGFYLRVTRRFVLSGGALHSIEYSFGRKRQGNADEEVLRIYLDGQGRLRAETPDAKPFTTITNTGLLFDLREVLVQAVLDSPLVALPE